MVWYFLIWYGIAWGLNIYLLRDIARRCTDINFLCHFSVLPIKYRLLLSANLAKLQPLLYCKKDYTYSDNCVYDKSLQCRCRTFSVWIFFGFYFLTYSYISADQAENLDVNTDWK